MLWGSPKMMTHATITIELFDRGLAIHMSLEFARAFTAFTRYLDD